MTNLILTFHNNRVLTLRSVVKSNFKMWVWLLVTYRVGSSFIGRALLENKTRNLNLLILLKTDYHDTNESDKVLQYMQSELISSKSRLWTKKQSTRPFFSAILSDKS
jgi:hypothetical protein